MAQGVSLAYKNVMFGPQLLFKIFIWQLEALTLKLEAIISFSHSEEMELLGLPLA